MLYARRKTIQPKQCRMRLKGLHARPYHMAIEDASTKANNKTMNHSDVTAIRIRWSEDRACSGWRQVGVY